MIRINLVPRGKSVRSSKDVGGGATNDQGFDVNQLQKQGVIKIIILLLVPFALYAFELQSIPEKKAQYQSKKTLAQGLKAKNERAKGALEETNRFREDQAKLQAQIQMIESLSKDRLKTIKILDTIQRDIPDKIWLTKLEVNDDRVVLKGLAKSDFDLTVFMESLQKSIHFREVNLVRSSEQASDKGNLKQFEINCVIERGENRPTPAGGA